jgi:Uma2 family endonuclease
MNAINLPHFKYDDFVQWEGRWELVDGHAHSMAPAPSEYHQDISAAILSELGSILKDCKTCRATHNINWKINETTVLEPDVLVLCFPKDKTRLYITQAPAMIFEIVSPFSIAHDRVYKFNIYAQEGVNYYIIIDPEKELAQVYTLTNGTYMLTAELTTGFFTFNLTSCLFDFGAIW